jgi:hypothetical protein
MMGGQQEAMNRQAQPKQMALFDAVCDALLGETRRYEESLGVVKGRLEVCRPTEGRDCQKDPEPQTVQQQLAAICTRIRCCNEGLTGLIDRIEEQVGELKILP